MADRRCGSTLLSFFTHLGCSCGRHCLISTDVHDSGSSGFTGKGEINCFPSISIN